jgi:hypothetical protein
MVTLMFVLWQLVRGIEKLTGLDMDSIFHADKKTQEKTPPSEAKL